MQTPAVYFPFASGRYEVSPGLNRFGKDLGNGIEDRRVFQIDCDFAKYRQTKLASNRFNNMTVTVGGKESES